MVHKIRKYFYIFSRLKYCPYCILLGGNRTCTSSREINVICNYDGDHLWYAEPWLFYAGKHGFPLFFCTSILLINEVFMYLTLIYIAEKYHSVHKSWYIIITIRKLLSHVGSTAVYKWQRHAPSLEIHTMMSLLLLEKSNSDNVYWWKLLGCYLFPFFSPSQAFAEWNSWRLTRPQSALSLILCSLMSYLCFIKDVL